MHFLILILTSTPLAAAVTIPSGFSRTLFEDDFSLQTPGSLPSPQKWSLSLGTSYPGGPANWGTNEVQTYTDTNVVITPARTLRITPQRTDWGSWTSSRIETLPRWDFACPAGGKLRVETSLRFGNAPQESQMGIWPAFWSMGSDFRGNYTQWPAAGEIDIAESINGVSKLYVALHCGWAPGGPCDEYNGLKMTAPLNRGQFYTFAVEIDRTNAVGGWRGESLTWFVDGRVLFRLDGGAFEEWVWTAVTRRPKFLILNVAVGGDFADNAENPGRVKTPTAETRGGEGAGLEVRYIAVFST
ncbi:concanavalin A-like lectin/glucanase domain-containing protein [Cercophora newfieldiana]|uniref:Concanavalin A-like lectin/glucanase domain-containing protein n=1 Tax=Cercophora newfieldiana TaxID=92897 RepID=A0AA39YN74_9PEZI|nr:concanavalin A-like lectin/glucanase domain-containing protein [Cercophora newfieldiana]